MSDFFDEVVLMAETVRVLTEQQQTPEGRLALKSMGDAGYRVGLRRAAELVECAARSHDDRAWPFYGKVLRDAAQMLREEAKS